MVVVVVVGTKMCNLLRDHEIQKSGGNLNGHDSGASPNCVGLIGTWNRFWVQSRDSRLVFTCFLYHYQIILVCLTFNKISKLHRFRMATH